MNIPCNRISSCDILSHKGERRRMSVGAVPPLRTPLTTPPKVHHQQLPALTRPGVLANPKYSVAAAQLFFFVSGNARSLPLLPKRTSKLLTSTTSIYPNIRIENMNVITLLCRRLWISYLGQTRIISVQRHK